MPLRTRAAREFYAQAANARNGSGPLLGLKVAEPEIVQEEGRLLNQELLDRGVVRAYV